MGRFIAIIAFYCFLVIGLALLIAFTYNLTIMIINNEPYLYYLYWNIAGWVFFAVFGALVGYKVFYKRNGDKKG